MNDKKEFITCDVSMEEYDKAANTIIEVIKYIVPTLDIRDYEDRRFLEALSKTLGYLVNVIPPLYTYTKEEQSKNADAS